MENRLRYLQILGQLGESLGDWRKGEIQIVTTDELIDKAERESNSPVGVLDEDRYLIHLRDAVLFPPKSGETEPRLGTYIRLVYTYQLQGNLGISILPINSDGQIVLNLAYRHALRRWSLEAAGTIGKEGESVMDSVQRCVRDELGCEPLESTLLTENFVPERGLLGGLVPMYIVKVNYQPDRSHVDPTVSGHVLMSTAGYWDAVMAGKYLYEGKEYICCDGYTNTAVRLAEIKGLV